MRKMFIGIGLALPIVAGVGLLSVAASTPAQADHPTVQSQVQHYFECLHWLFSDPAKHKEFCSPGFDYFMNSSNFAAANGVSPGTISAPPPSASSVPPVSEPGSSSGEPLSEPSSSSIEPDPSSSSIEPDPISSSSSVESEPDPSLPPLPSSSSSEETA